MSGRLTTVTLAALLVLALLPGAAAAAESLASMFDEANNAFWNGEYERAAELYAELEELGARSPSLSYNRGTAEARVGNLGRAVQHFERTLRQDPGHADALHNVAAIREFIARRASEQGRDADLAPAVGPWRAVLDRFSPTSAAVAFLVFHIALFGALILRRFIVAETPRLTLGVLAGVLAVLTLATGAVTVGKWNQETGEREAIVVVRGTLEVMEGPESEVERFLLDEGSRVVLLEDRERWVKLRDDQGRDGWAPTEGLGEI
jgi:tetratricopeptide (TPR) repeat protein